MTERQRAEQLHRPVAAKCLTSTGKIQASVIRIAAAVIGPLQTKQAVDMQIVSNGHDRSGLQHPVGVKRHAIEHPVAAGSDELGVVETTDHPATDRAAIEEQADSHLTLVETVGGVVQQTSRLDMQRCR